MRDLGPAEHFAAGALGEPGQRRFFIQVTAGGETVWFPAEKQQIAALGSQCIQLVTTADLTPDTDAVAKIRADLAITEPQNELFGVGGIQIAVLESHLIAVVITSPEEDESARFIVAPEQLQAMAEVAMAVVASGRPICPRCQLPEEPAGHRCPASNGHHRD